MVKRKGSSHKSLSFAQWVMKERGVRGLWHVMDLVVLWSAATAVGEAATNDAVRAFGEITSWGSQAKFYRELNYWRDLTGTDSPESLVPELIRRGARSGEFGQVLGGLWATPASFVVGG